jgi:hypothetical protein
MTMPATVRKAGDPSARFVAVLRAAARGALQWRVLLLWLIASWIPTALLTLPLWRLFSSWLDHTVHASQWAHSPDLVVLSVLVGRTVRLSGDALAGSGVAAGIVLCALIPLLNAMLVTASRAPAGRVLGFEALLQGALKDYGAMLRLMLWALVPLAFALGLGVLALRGAHHYEQGAILAADAELASRTALAVLAVLVLLALASIDAGRARLAFDPYKRSAIKAWWRGLRLVLSQPLRAIGLFVVITVLALLLAAALGLARTELAADSIPAAVGGLLIVQLIVLVTAWMHFARLLALLALTRLRATAPA